MKTNVVWNQNMNFTGTNDKQAVVMDAKSPIGRGEGLTPKELVAIGMAGCSAMDVIALMKKHKQNVTSFSVAANVETSASGHPVVFTKAELVYNIGGENLDNAKVIEAVELSQSEYCGVSAMLSKAFPIEYRILVNQEQIATGKASF